MYTLNKLVWGFANPAVIGLCALVIGMLCASRFRLVSRIALAFAALWLWFFMTPLCSEMLGVPLERDFLADGKVPRIADFAQSDAIIIHGGSMGGSSNICEYAEMWSSADRVWQGARLYKAGKAPQIIVTSGGVDFSTVPLLADFGVPTNAIVIIDKPRNTEEEAKAVASLLGQRSKVKGQTKEFNHHCLTSDLGPLTSKPKVLVVSSAWHMKRTILMYAKYAPDLEAIPAPADWEFSVREGGFSWGSLYPQAEFMERNSYAFHEWLGLIWYRYFR